MRTNKPVTKEQKEAIRKRFLEVHAEGRAAAASDPTCPYASYLRAIQQPPAKVEISPQAQPSTPSGGKSNAEQRFDAFQKRMIESAKQFLKDHPDVTPAELDEMREAYGASPVSHLL